MLNYVAITTSMEEGAKLHSNIDAKYVEAMDYKSLIWSFIYFTYLIPNILYAISCLRRFILASKYSHLKAIKKIPHYIKVIINYNIFLPKNLNKKLIVYVDSN